MTISRIVCLCAVAISLIQRGDAANNVLLIIADDFGTDASSLYNSSPGASLAPTPNLASLAANGVKFTNAYACPVCSPTRSCILTGRHGFRTGTGNVVSGPSGNALKAAEFTLPDAFAANSGLGFQLKHFGKWHLGGGNQSPSTNGGWPAFAGSLAGEISSYTSWTKVITNGTPGGTSSSTSTTYATTDLVNDAVSWIQLQSSASKPWMAWVAFNAPHTPFHLPSPTSLCPHYTTLSGTTQDINNNPRNYYNAAIEAMDTEIGRLLAAVDLAKTTVIFIGDNGTPGQVLQTPFPTGHGKDTLYEGGIRVPMLVRDPDVISPGRSEAGFVHVVDLYATILELAGISVTNTVPSTVTLDSQSLRPVLLNQPITRSRNFSEEFDTATPTLGGFVLRDDQFKLIRKRTGVDEFYDLLSDPYESTNLFISGVAGLSASQLSAYYKLRFAFSRYTATPTPSVTAAAKTALGMTLRVPQISGYTQTLWRTTDLENGLWAPVAGATSSVASGEVSFTDPSPPQDRAFYSVVAEAP